MKNKLSRNLRVLICSILLISAVCGGIFIINNKHTALTTLLNNNNTEDLIVSLYDTDGKSNITKVNLASKEETKLVSDREVWLSGNLSEDKNSLIYMDAIGDEPWQVFSLNLKNNKTYKVTTDNIGKFGGKSGNGSTLYFQTLDKSSGIAKIAKINTEDKSSEIFDNEDKDRDVQVYDSRNDKIIAVMFSNAEDNKRHTEASKTKQAKTNLKPMDYTICEINADGSNIKRIASVSAKSITSISYNYDGKKAIIYGENINNENDYGIYELSIETGEMKSLLTNTMIHDKKDCIISEIRDNESAILSKDEKLLYFTGRPKGSEKLKFLDTTSYPQEIYSYNLTTQEIKEVYKYNRPTIITNLTISY
ncbi:hypothetical protein [Clostridium beijerinckii]|uniref:hypothetical protein n=1 Tax=Clostridium beijerinckii TaxID=1520 RepID=UPI0004797790|nr:hypothetical protein [Clostridium beijerinckii]